MNNAIHSNKYLHDKISNKYNKRHTEIYNIYEQKRIASVVKKVCALIDNKHISVLDYGAGTGNLTHFFLEHGCEVTALDISSNSLDVLLSTYKEYEHSLSTKVFDGEKIPFVDNSFDIIATYSVLHHIPDYLAAVKDMVRALKKGGILYIDHEANENKRHPGPVLSNYYKKTNRLWPKIVKVLKSGELFEYDFRKGLYIRAFVDKRYRNEGDIHVFPDDHIERDTIVQVLQDVGMHIIEKKDYLMYNESISLNEYENIKDTVNDTSYIIAKKM